jgi:methionyl-tRNA formyltransferase
LKKLSNKSTILFLGPVDSGIFRKLNSAYSVTICQAPLLPDDHFIQRYDLAVSFRYRHILSADVLKKFKRPVLNLHISFLPWNRGADPNFWSFLEKTPSGISIHQIDTGIDTGPILFQKRIEHDLDSDTLATSYQRLVREIETLFFLNLPTIFAEEVHPKKQTSIGTYHTSADKQKHIKLLHSGWNTPLRDIWGAAT